MNRPAPDTLNGLIARTEKRWQWFGENTPIGECWCGVGDRVCRGGYVRIDLRIKGLGGRQVRLSAHIVAWLLDHLGPMGREDLFLAYCEFRASGLQLDHLCDEPSCRRPSHLNPCTQKENIAAGKERQYLRDLARGPVENFEPDPEEIMF